jgi:hypothetical protein
MRRRIEKVEIEIEIVYNNTLLTAVVSGLSLNQPKTDG